MNIVNVTGVSEPQHRFSKKYMKRIEMAEVAIIGWGSLLWDLDDLDPKVNGEWHIGEGPQLPLEFVRISPKRKQSLVVVTDLQHGAPCGSSYIKSKRTNIEAAIDDLAARERTKADEIGAVSDQQIYQAKHPEIAKLVQDWLKTSPCEAAIWTDLSANFELETGLPFDVDTAISYLKTLKGESLLEAKRYIDFAPPQVVTPLRNALNKNGWWQGLRLE